MFHQRSLLASVAAMTLSMTLAMSSITLAQRSANLSLHAVPATQPVKFDGVLEKGEWDLSGEILSTKDVRALLDTESCRVATMYDDTYLYIAFQFRDPTPLANAIDPRTMSGNGWRSDAVQLRCNMEGYITHVDGWFFAPRSEPAMSINYIDFAKKPQAPHTTDRPKDGLAGGGKLAFRKMEDGGGYVQEMAIPWALITRDAKRPSKGAALKLGLELIWGNPLNGDWPQSRVVDNFVTPETKSDFWWTSSNSWGKLVLEDKNNVKLPAPAWLAERPAEPQAPVEITFNLATESFVTIAIEDAAGNRVKSLIADTQFKSGDNVVRWDGLNDRNEPLPAGDYRWTGLYRDPLTVKWVQSFYQPNSKRPWTTGDGRGAWGPDHGTIVGACAGGGQLYFVGNGVEAGEALMAVDADGTKLWSLKQAEADQIAYANDGGEGIPVLWTYAGEQIINFVGFAKGGVMKIDAATGKWMELPGADGKPILRKPLLEETEQAVGFSADSSGVFIAVKDKNEVRQFDPKDLSLKKTFKISAAGPLFATGDGTILIAARNAIQRLNLTDGSVKTLIETDLASAQRITASAKGNVYVTVAAPRHQIKAFTPASDGQLVAGQAIGREGGRPAKGLYDPTIGFRVPAGIAVDEKDRLWVVERAESPILHPRRMSIWSADGVWQRDFIGDTFYGGGGVLDPQDPTTAWYYGLRFKLDPTTGTSTLLDLNIETPPSASASDISLEMKEGEDPTEFALVHEGRTYLICGRTVRMVSRKRPDGRWAMCSFIDPIKKLGWVDRNDDFDMQPEEITRGAKTDDWGRNDYWGSRPATDLTQYFNRGIDKPGLRLQPTGYTAGGAPLYDFSKFTPMGGEIGNGIGLKDGAYVGVSTGDRGEYFSEVRRIETAAGQPRKFWYRGAQTGRWTSRLPAPGLVLYPFQAHGAIAAPKEVGGELLCFVSDFGQRYLFTSDLLLVGQLFRDGRERHLPWPADPTPGFDATQMTPGQESFHGFFTRTSEGKYLLTSGFTDCRLFEVNGIDSLRRFGGGLKLEESQLARAEEIRQMRLAQAGSAVNQKITIAKATITVDGTNGDWANVKGDAVIRVDAERSARMQTASDEQALYVIWEVKDPTPLLPNTASRPELFFKGGDSVDLMWRAAGQATDPKALRRGDLRLLITADSTNEPKAMLYRPVSTSKQPFVFDAFEGANRPNAVKMDEVRLAPEVRVAVKRDAERYVVEASIPWTLLGGKPGAAAEGSIDFGVLYGDGSNTATTLRTYWSNRGTNMTADIPTEAKLMPENWGRWAVSNP